MTLQSLKKYPKKITPFLILLFINPILALAQATDKPVKIESGLISGTNENALRVYRGIPYAAPPLGDLRWQAPQLPAKWNGVKAMEKFGASCIQPVREGRESLREQSEDCLTLNVWASAKSAKVKLPVMVWIHGGAHTMGGAAIPFYDGKLLAKQGVIVVTINYRLGDFGYFAHPDLNKQNAGGIVTNFGLADQIAALKWVQRNIEKFGGDAKNVTIFGESAGGNSISYLIISPVTKGLFAKAIIESGGGFQQTRRLSESSPNQPSQEEIGKQLVKDLGLENEAHPIDAMRKIPGEDLMKRLAEAKTRRGAISQLGGYGSVIDGNLVVGEPGAMFEAGKYNKVPILIGSNSNEASLMTSFGIPPAAIFATLGANRERALKIYQADGSDQNLIAGKMFGDSVFVAPARFIARANSKSGQPTWLYHFSYVTERQRGTARGANHGVDVVYVFNTIGEVSPLATENDKKFGSIVSAYWAQFAKTGDPNGGDRPEWKAYKTESDELLELGLEIKTRARFRQAQLDLHEEIYRARKIKK